jgi:hypothetical protein
MPKVLVSIVNHQNRDRVHACLASLPAACEGIDWSATVIDNASGDGSLEMLATEFPDVAVLANRSRLGFGANHNQVLRPLISNPAVAPDYVLILNDDTVLEPLAVTRLAARLDGDPALAAVVPTIKDIQGRVAASRIAYPSAYNAWRTDWTDVTEPPDPDHGYLQGCCLLLRVQALVEVGPFDERFFLFYEDVDLSRRLSDAGWALGICPEAVVIHEGHASVFQPEMVEVTPLQGRRSRYLYFRKHDGRLAAEFITSVGRLLLLIRLSKAISGGVVRRDPTRRVRIRRLWALARLDPRRPIPPDPSSAAGG